MKRKRKGVGKRKRERGERERRETEERDESKRKIISEIERETETSRNIRHFFPALILRNIVLNNYCSRIRFIIDIFFCFKIKLLNSHVEPLKKLKIKLSIRGT